MKGFLVNLHLIPECFSMVEWWRMAGFSNFRGERETVLSAVEKRGRWNGIAFTCRISHSLWSFLLSFGGNLNVSKWCLCMFLLGDKVAVMLFLIYFLISFKWWSWWYNWCLKNSVMNVSLMVHCCIRCFDCCWHKIQSLASK